MSEASAFLASALGVSTDAIAPDAALGGVPAWDSLGHARLLIALETRLGRQLTPDEAVAIESLFDIEAILCAQPLIGQ